MIICLCNALTEAQLGEAVAQGARRPRDVYAACACKAQCGTCTRTIVSMIREVVPAPVAVEEARLAST